MNSSRIEGRWEQVKGQIEDRWGKLTDDDLDRVDGKREELRGRIQERYARAREDAERELEELTRRL